MTTAAIPSNKTTAPYVRGLKCRECGSQYDKAPVHVCEMCFGPLEVDYDYAAIGQVLTRATIESRPHSMWRYAELLPLDGPPAVGQQSGMTPLVRADRLAKRLGLKEVWVKNDAVSYPTLSFKDRVVSVAVSKALEFGIGTIACASTGNLANDAAVLAGKPLAHGAAVGLGGQLLTVAAHGRPCYRCFFEEPPPAGVGPSCAEAGVLGPVPGVIGALLGAEAARLAKGETPAFVGRLVQYDSRSMSVRAVRFNPNPQCAVCAPGARIRALAAADYPAADCNPP